MYRRLFFCIFFSFAVSMASARILRVGFEGSAVPGVDFTGLTAAHNAASAGDTIQIYGSVSGGTINKPLVIQGFGYNLDKHVGLHYVNTDQPSVIHSSIRFDPGAEGTIVEGVSCNVVVYTGDLVIRRCRLSDFNVYTSERNISNLKIYSCLLLGLTVSGTNNCTNFQMYNCLVTASASFYSNDNGGHTGLIVNCIFTYNSSSSHNFNENRFEVRNCIFKYYRSGNTNTVYENNIFTIAQPSVLPIGANNVWEQAWSDIFEQSGSATGSEPSPSSPEFDENYYLLKPGSAAMNAGIDLSGNPTDCGIFSGEAAYRYKPGGLPPIPSIYKLTAPSPKADSNPYKITISVRGNN